MAGGHDEGGLLALDEADRGLAAQGQQVLAVEALVELPVQGQTALADELHVRPALKSHGDGSYDHFSF